MKQYITLFLLTSVSCASSVIPNDYAELKQCLLLLKSDAEVTHTSESCERSVDGIHCDSSWCQQTLHQLTQAYFKEPKISTHALRNSSKHPYWLRQTLANSHHDICSVLIVKNPILDRTCLMTPLPTKPTSIKVVNLTEGFEIDNLISTVNYECNTFRDVKGTLTLKGYHHKHILDNLFSVQSLENSQTADKLFGANKTDYHMPQCEKITLESWETFFTSYLQYSKPVIIKQATETWKAKNKWTKGFLHTKYGNKTVHIKMSPTKDYEGIESVNLWEKYKSFKIPQMVKEKLQFPDLVVPRPAPVSMNFSAFLDFTEKVAEGKIQNASAYLEYSSIRNYFPELENDISEMPFINGKMMLRHLNIWLSDGNTVGKLHFDPFDNFLCMIDGTKQVILFEPHHNEYLYEAHIPEAEFAVNMSTLTFRRRRLMESTSMVMSPIDIQLPDFARFPLFNKARPLNCTVGPGEVLFMPAFWWHEVQSSPDVQRLRNLAVNFWYEPFLQKEFPCPECRLDVNPFYYHLL